MAFVDNHFLVFYSTAIVEAAINECENSKIGLDQSFLNVEKFVYGRGLCRVYLNYAYLPQFLAIYMPSSGRWFDAFTVSMDFAGLSLETVRDRIEVHGGTILGKTPYLYLAALMSSGKQSIKAYEIIPARTAFYADVGFSDPATFVSKLAKALAESDPIAFDSYKKTRRYIEKLLRYLAYCQTSLRLTMDYLPYEQQSETFAGTSVDIDTAAVDAADEAMSENATREQELMSELKRFHKDGTLSLRGKYTSGKPSGTRKDYTSDGRSERKEKY
jgi:hypothetical protein